MSATVPLLAAGANGPRRVRRAIEIPALDSLLGPDSGVLTVPRRLYWSGDEQCGTVNLSDENEVALAYESIIDAARFPGDLTEYLNAGLLVRVWPTLGIGRDRRQAWESRNPALAAARAVPSARVPTTTAAA